MHNIDCNRCFRIFKLDGKTVIQGRESMLPTSRWEPETPIPIFPDGPPKMDKLNFVPRKILDFISLKSSISKIEPRLRPSAAKEWEVL